jgi:hypothetical protein
VEPESVKRLERSVAEVDPRTTHIVIAHFAMERELDHVLSQLLPRASKLRGLGFGHKVSLLLAFNPTDSVDKIGPFLLALNDLRNSAAHNDPKVAVDKYVARFFQHTAVPEALWADRSGFEQAMGWGAALFDVFLVAARQRQGL